jgi:hypothetical protein
MSEIAWVLIALASIVGVNITVTVLVARAVYKRARRSRALGGAALRTRARLSWGQHHDVLSLRVRLHDSLHSGQAAVDLILQSGGSRGEIPRLFRRIESEGLTLEAQLRLLESETDAAVLTRELPIARDRVEQVVALVRHLRAAVASGLGEFTEETLIALRSDVNREVAALHAGVQELQALHKEGNQL